MRGLTHAPSPGKGLGAWGRVAYGSAACALRGEQCIRLDSLGHEGTCEDP